MMRNNLKLVIGILLTILIIACSTIVFADNSQAIILPTNQTTENTEAAQNTVQNTVQNSAQNEVQNEIKNTTTYNSVNTSTSYSTNTEESSLPKTGAEDVYVVSILLVVCAISAIYAYRKIRDYNIK